MRFWEISERFPMPVAKKTVPAARSNEQGEYRPEFVAKVKEAAAQPSTGTMTGEEALARLAALTKGANG